MARPVLVIKKHEGSEPAGCHLYMPVLECVFFYTFWKLILTYITHEELKNYIYEKECISKMHFLVGYLETETYFHIG